MLVVAASMLACVQPMDPLNAIDALGGTTIGQGLSVIARGEQSDTWTGSGAVSVDSRGTEFELFGDEVGAGMVSSDTRGTSRAIEVVAVEGLQVLPDLATAGRQELPHGDLGLLLADADHALRVEYRDERGQPLSGGGLALRATTSEVRFQRDPRGFDQAVLHPALLGAGELTITTGALTSTATFEAVELAELELSLTEQEDSRSWGQVWMELSARRGGVSVALPEDEMLWTVNGRRHEHRFFSLDELPATVCVELRGTLNCTDVE